MSRLALAAGVGTFVLLCCALGSTYAADEVVHSPIRPEGVWRWVLVGSITGAFLLFLLGLWLVRRRGAPLAAVVAIAAAIQLAPLAVPLLLSTDVYGYWESGWIAAVADKSPYDHPPGEFLENPANAHRGAAWNDYPTW